MVCVQYAYACCCNYVVNSKHASDVRYSRCHNRARVMLVWVLELVLLWVLKLFLLKTLFRYIVSLWSVSSCRLSGKWQTTILVKTIVRFRWGKCYSSWLPSPLNSVGCYKSNTFYISCTLYGPQLRLAGVGENLVKVVFMSMYHRLAALVPYKTKWKRGGVPTPFGQDCSCARLVKQHSHSLYSSSCVKGWVYNDWSSNLSVCVGFLWIIIPSLLLSQVSN